MENDFFTDREIDRAAAESRRVRDLDDQQNEVSGRDVGRQQKFLGKDNPNGSAAQRRKNQQAASMTALQVMLANDAEYAALYNDVSDLLGRAESATELALQEAEQDLSEAQSALGDAMDGANRLPDGTVIFRDANGNVRDENGELIEGEELDGVVWKDDAPSYEDYMTRKQAIEDARQQIEALRRYQIDVLGRARDRMNDPDNPISREELDRIQKDIEEQAQPAVKSRLEPDASEASPQRTSALNMDVPKA